MVEAKLMVFLPLVKIVEVPDHHHSELLRWISISPECPTSLLPHDCTRVQCDKSKKQIPHSSLIPLSEPQPISKSAGANIMHPASMKSEEVEFH